MPASRLERLQSKAAKEQFLDDGGPEDDDHDEQHHPEAVGLVDQVPCVRSDVEVVTEEQDRGVDDGYQQRLGKHPDGEARQDVAALEGEPQRRPFEAPAGHDPQGHAEEPEPERHLEQRHRFEGELLTDVVVADHHEEELHEDRHRPADSQPRRNVADTPLPLGDGRIDRIDRRAVHRANPSEGPPPDRIARYEPDHTAAGPEPEARTVR